jgi:hypothetical protein
MGASKGRGTARLNKLIVAAIISQNPFDMIGWAQTSKASCTMRSSLSFS